MGLRYLLFFVLALYVFVAFLVPALQNVFGYGFGTVFAIFVLWYAFVGYRGRV